MFDRAEPILKLVCLGLGAILIYQLATLPLRVNPLRRVSIPELPALTTGTNAPGEGEKSAAPKNVTAPAVAVTNSTVARESTNAVTNLVSATMSEAKGTNATGVVVSNNVATNVAFTITNATNLTDGKSNLVQAAAKKGTNAVVKSAVTSHAPPPGMMVGQGNAGAELPPLIQARIDRIYQSEILGQVMRPMPMGLLGIAGGNAFLRAPSGQTGMIKEGEELGGIKLLRIGTNRVLVEQGGDKKELMIFSGFGGESLLPKQKETNNETKSK